MRRCLRAKLLDAFACRRERLGVDRVDVAQPCAHFQGALRSAAEEQKRMRLLQRPHIRMCAFDPIERASEIERLFARPGQFH